MVRIAGALLALLVVAPTGTPRLAGAVPAVPAVVVTYQAPVPGSLDVVRPFAPPRTRYGPGHLGVDLRVARDSAVFAAGAGTVTFAGPVAGRGVVVVLHPDGVRTEYEPLAVAVHAGDRVVGGALLGRARGVHGRCAAGRCLHWGARRGSSYFDPLSLLRALGPVRLLPWAEPP